MTARYEGIPWTLILYAANWQFLDLTKMLVIGSEAFWQADPKEFNHYSVNILWFEMKEGFSIAR